MSTEKRSKFSVALEAGGRMLAIGIILGVAVLGAKILSSMKDPPAQAVVVELALPVEAIKVVAEDVPIMINGYGEVQALNRLQITPEVAGTAVEVHPRLEVGEIIPAGDLLFRIDPRNYASALDQARASVAQSRSTIERLQEQARLDRARLETLARSLELARAEYQRIQKLFEQDEVGTRSGVEQAEMRVNQSQDLHDQLKQAVDLYGTRIAEAQSALAAAQAQVDMAEANLERTEVRAPFHARVQMVRVESGQYVSPGNPVLTLVDDSVLEISVPLDSIDARRWLQFTQEPTAEAGVWFNHLEPVTCRIYWTEEPGAHTWYGTLDRVESFDPATRTLTVAIRVSGNEAVSPDGDRLPLVEGMYCQVAIPGKTMDDVFRVPRWAVSFDSKIYVAENDRLQVREVDVMRTENEETFISEGLDPGDTVVVTRLVDPMPDTLLEIALFEETSEAL